MKNRSARLLDEQALRGASLADAQREYEAGELSPQELAAVVARDEAALARIELELASLVDELRPVRPHRRPRLLVVALACFLLAAGVALWSALATRQPGDSATGGISTSASASVSRLLAEAELDVANGRVNAALAAYNSVLSLSAHNETALSESGWLYVSAGSRDGRPALVTLGTQRIVSAVRSYPNDAGPRLYYGIVLASLVGRAAQAKEQFRVFLALNPTAGQRAAAQPWLVQFGLN
jgi:tetratricopeptide (TPR) repeat protein